MNDAFNSQVSGWIDEALKIRPVIDFNGLVRALPGVHPNDVANILSDQQQKSLIASRQGENALHVLAEDDLPAPHPLDYDWRFTEATKVLLLERMSIHLPFQGSITLLGVPTLFAKLRYSFPDSTVTLADSSSESIFVLSEKCGSEGLFFCDLLKDPLPQIKADVVIADPPWYPEHFEAFIWAASQILCIGGHLLLCGPNSGTRPGAEAEWRQIQDYAHSVGFELSSFEDSLRYETPPFEQNALYAAGHPPISTDWRSGRLATFVLRSVPVAERPVKHSGLSKWTDHRIQGVRWRIRHKESAEVAAPQLRPLVEGDILNSVSRRDSRRSQIDVWTSGNRIFGCADTCILNLVIEALAIGTSPDTYVESSISRQLTAIERDQIQTSEKQVKAIIELERKEYLRSAENISVS